MQVQKPALIRQSDAPSLVYSITNSEVLQNLDASLNQVRSFHHRQFLDRVTSNFARLTETRQLRERMLRVVGNEIQRWHKMKDRKRDLQEKERIQALKNNDEVAYRKLLEEAKNERLSHLLNQTDAFMNQISGLVKQHQDSLRVVEKERALSDAPAAAETVGPVTGKKYYADAHAVTEEITEQPRMLGNSQLKLKEYQLVGLRWLVSLYVNSLNGILADEMGLGKTIETIALLAYLAESKNNPGPHIIIVPLSTISNWLLEFKNWCPSLNVIVYRGTKQQRREIFLNSIRPGGFNVILTTYQFSLKDNDLLHPHYQFLIIDEGHRIKNKQAKLSKRLREFNVKNRLILTGTPLQNDLDELWSLLNFLLPTIFNSADSFNTWFNDPLKAGSNALGVSEEESLLVITRLHQVLSPFLLRRKKTEVASQLPSKTEEVLACSMSAMQKLLYKTMAKSSKVAIDPAWGKKRK